MEVVVVASFPVGSRLCASLRQARLAARLVESDGEAGRVAAPDGVVVLHVGPSQPAARRVAALLARHPGLRVVVLGPADPGPDLIDALLAGAAGYLPHDLELEALARSLHGVVDGEMALPRGWVGRVVAALRVAVGAPLVAATPGA